MTNQLFYGDNLDILRDHIADESVDLIYLDPPFNSNRNYNVLFKEKSGQESASQIEVFEDTWTWDANTAFAYHELTTTQPESVASMIASMRQFVGSNDMMAYLVMMAQRLKELHRVLKPTGSIYLHCDPTASHYLKTLMDTVFGITNFKNEIIWRRTGAHSSAKKYAPVHDVILFYAKTPQFVWNDPRAEYDEDYLETRYRQKDEDGRRYFPDNLTAAGTRQGRSGLPWRGIDPAAKGVHWKFTVDRLDELDAEGRIYWPTRGGMPRYKRYVDELKGLAVTDLWTDIDSINSQGKERLGYPTQKPITLLERIIQSSSNEGEVVLDPFCGCGTAVAAAQKLNRRWIGIDITHLAVSLVRTRLVDHFGKQIESEIEVVGEPKDLGAAQALFDANPFQFEWWALSLVPAMPGNDKKKGADRGVDGIVYFHVDNSGKPQKAIVQVKGGKVQSPILRDLRGTMTRENAAMAILVTLQPPTSAMRQEAANAGVYETPLGRTYPAIQILTIEELLDGKEPRIPREQATFKKASRISRNQQPALDLGDV